MNGKMMTILTGAVMTILGLRVIFDGIKSPKISAAHAAPGSPDPLPSFDGTKPGQA